MTVKLFDIIQETTVSTGIGDMALAGAVGSYLPFGMFLTDGQQFPYTITDQTSDRETGTATYHAVSNSFTRTTVLSSTNGGSLVPFGTGPKYVFMDLQAEMFSGTAGNLLLTQGTNTAPASVAMSGDATLAGTGAITVVSAGGGTGAFTAGTITSLAAAGGSFSAGANLTITSGLGDTGSAPGNIIIRPPTPATGNGAFGASIEILASNGDSNSSSAGGPGGIAELFGGSGGNSVTGAGGGAGGVFITAGAGGNATAGTRNGGAGANVILAGGTGGTSFGGTAGANGQVRIGSNIGTTGDVSAEGIVYASAATRKPLVVQGYFSQSANLQEWQSHSAGVLASVSSAGLITATFSGALTGNVTGNCSGSAGSVDAGNITGTTLASGVTGSSLTSVGTLTGLTVTNPITGSVTGSAGSLAGGTSGQLLISQGSASSFETLSQDATVTNAGVLTVVSAGGGTGAFAAGPSRLTASGGLPLVLIDGRWGSAATTSVFQVQLNSDGGSDVLVGNGADISTSNGCTVWVSGSYPGVLARNTGIFGFTPLDYAFAESADTCISRVSANVLGIGNGTQGDVSGTVQAATFIGNLTGNASGSAGSVAAGNITGTTLASGVTGSSLTSLGTLTSLTLNGNVTLSAATTIAAPANTAAALKITDGTNAYYTLNTQTATDNTVNHTFANGTATSYAAASGSTHSLVGCSAYTLTLTGTTGVTALNGLSLNIGAPTVTNSSAGLTVTTVSTLYISAPIAAGNASFTNSRLVDTNVAGCYCTAAGVWTSTSGLGMKQDISTDLSATLADLDAVQPIRYRYKDASDGGFQRYGLVAEEVPDFLASGNRAGLAAIHVAGFAVACSKSLKQKMEAAEARLAELERRLMA